MLVDTYLWTFNHFYLLNILKKKKNLSLAHFVFIFFILKNAVKAADYRHICSILLLFTSSHSADALIHIIKYWHFCFNAVLKTVEIKAHIYFFSLCLFQISGYLPSLHLEIIADSMINDIIQDLSSEPPESVNVPTECLLAPPLEIQEETVNFQVIILSYKLNLLLLLLYYHKCLFYILKTWVVEMGEGILILWEKTVLFG